MPILSEDKLKKIMPSQYGIEEVEPVEKPAETEVKKISKEPKPEGAKLSERQGPVSQRAVRQPKKDKLCKQDCKYAYGSRSCNSCVNFKGE